MDVRSPECGVHGEGDVTPEIEAGNNEGDLTLEIGIVTEEMTGPGIGKENDDTPRLALALGILDVAIIKISKSGGLGIGNEGIGLHPLIRREAAA